MGMVLQLTEDIQVFDPPTTAAEYAAIFGPFRESEFLAFNANFPMEEDRDILEGAIQVHRDRLSTTRLDCRYIFFRQDSVGRAVEFFERLGRAPGMASHVERVTRLFVEKPAHHSVIAETASVTYFIGYDKTGVSRCVVYLYAIKHYEKPVKILVIRAHSGIFLMLRRHFMDSWKRWSREFAPVGFKSGGADGLEVFCDSSGKVRCRIGRSERNLYWDGKLVHKSKSRAACDLLVRLIKHELERPKGIPRGINATRLAELAGVGVRGKDASTHISRQLNEESLGSEIWAVIERPTPSQKKVGWGLKAAAFDGL